MYICYFVDGRRGFVTSCYSDLDFTKKVLITRASDSRWMVPGTVSVDD